MKLSEAQKKVIAKMEPGKWYSAYGLRTSLATLDALEKKGILKSHGGLGSIFSPRTGIEFSLIGSASASAHSSSPAKPSLATIAPTAPHAASAAGRRRSRQN